MPSEPGNEHPAMERVTEAVEKLGLPTQRLERLKTAVAEATMNAMEHGSRYRSAVPVVIQVLFRILNKRESQLAIVVLMLARWGRALSSEAAYRPSSPTSMRAGGRP